MKKLSVLLLVCLLWIYGCEPDHVAAGFTPPVYTESDASLANVDFTFTFGGNNGLDVLNNNDYDIKVRVVNKSNWKTLINDLVLFPGDIATYNNLKILQGDKIEVQLWLGTASVWYSNYHGYEADLIAQGTLENGWTNLSIINTIIGYIVDLEMINGAVCEFSGRFSQSTPEAQLFNTFYCANTGPNVLHVEVFHLELRDGGGWEATCFITDFWIASYGANITQLAYNFGASEALAIRVSKHDPNYNWIVQEETLGFYLNVQAQSYAKIIGPVFIP